MANTILVGAQWGDEGKGKIIDVLTEDADYVVRTQGGNNAGHTVFIGEKKYVLHLIPSGIIHPGKTCVLGNGMVIDPKAFFEEADRLSEQGLEVTPERVLVSSRAHLILPYHRALDHYGHGIRPISMHSPGHVAATDEAVGRQHVAGKARPVDNGHVVPCAGQQHRGGGARTTRTDDNHVVVTSLWSPHDV